MEFLILTATRTSETLNMTFDEIDFETATWTVPKERMKMQREYQVPLSDRALAILKAQHETRGKNPHVFAGAATRSAVDDVAEHAFAPDEGPGDRSWISFVSTLMDGRHGVPFEAG